MSWADAPCNDALNKLHVRYTDALNEFTILPEMAGWSLKMHRDRDRSL